MNSQELPGEQKMLSTPVPRLRFSATVAKVVHLARREWLSWRLRWAFRRKGPTKAEDFFGHLLAGAAADFRGLSLLTGAVLRAARAEQARGRWFPASRLWVWYARISGDAHKACRNIIHCARATTKLRNDPAAVAEALECWNCLASMEAHSPEARQGIAWCHAGFARLAEQAHNWPAARAHWSAVLEIMAEDPAAIDGLRRATEAAAAPQNMARLQALYEQLKQTSGLEYGAQCAAAKLLLDMGAPEQAREFAARALEQTRGLEALLLLLRCQVAVGEMPHAAATLNELAQLGDLGAVAAADLWIALSHVAPDALSSETISKIAARDMNDALARALIPHLIAHQLHSKIATLTDAAIAGNCAWPEALVLETARDLLETGERERALRLLARFSAHPKAARAFAALADVSSPGQLEDLAAGAKDLTEEAGFALLLAVAEYHAGKRNELAATAIFDRIAAAGDAPRLYQHHKERLGALVAQITAGANPAAAQSLARFVIALLPENTKGFFAGAEFAALCHELAAAAQFCNAPETSRIGTFREQYFAHHMERRENQPVESVASDFALCEAVLRYFAAMAQLGPVERIPMSTEILGRLGQPYFRLGSGDADVLMSYAILRDRPDCDLKSGTLFAQLAGWYVSRFMPGNRVPSRCIGADVLSYFNTVEQDHSAVGIAVTRFANFIRSGSQASALQYRPENPLDALLFCLEAIPMLHANPHYRPFFAAVFLRNQEASLVDVCIAFLAGRDGLVFSRILHGDILFAQADGGPQRREGALQDVLVIGHEGESTGLGRNFRMLTAGLTGPDVRLATLSFEIEPEQFAESLKRWRENCRSAPVVVAAVNAHDIPALLVRDRHGVLAEAKIAGFFLWETSQAPRVQHLGVDLVDEVWAPTRYVADVYAPRAPTHVVGKGLFAAETAAPARMRAPGPLRFLTVFDFHSSIERKNPVASVLAFRKAFPGAEAVELIVKASNVNPQHPGNAFGQWERLCAEAEQDNRIRIIAERYSEEQMNRLIEQVGCVVSLHRSEGFGYVLSDAMALGIPVIATAHSGNLDFCDAETSFLVACQLVPVKALGAHWETQGAMWAEPDIDSAAAQMRHVYEDYPAALRVAAVGQRTILAKYATTVFAANVRARIAAMVNAKRGPDGARGAVH